MTTIVVRAAAAALMMVAAAVGVSTPFAHAQPVQDQQCADHEWAKLHPQICYPGGPFGFGGGTAGAGAGGGGGILDGIPIVGGLLHGLGL
jgi:hypothetical protein